MEDKIKELEKCQFYNKEFGQCLILNPNLSAIICRDTTCSGYKNCYTKQLIAKNEENKRLEKFKNHFLTIYQDLYSEG